jgi:hypothetical protein
MKQRQGRIVCKQAKSHDTDFNLVFELSNCTYLICDSLYFIGIVTLNAQWKKLRPKFNPSTSHHRNAIKTFELAQRVYSEQHYKLFTSFTRANTVESKMPG